MGILSGFAAKENADSIVKLFIAGVKDILSAALVVGLAGGIIIVLQEGHIIDPILHSLASLMSEAGRVLSLGIMYLIQTMINIIIPSGSAKAALTMPIMAPFLRRDRVIPTSHRDGLPVRGRVHEHDHPDFRRVDWRFGNCPYSLRYLGEIFLEIHPAACHYRFRVINSHGNHAVEWVLKFIMI